MQPIAAVAGEVLVAAVARERDGHVFARELANAVGRQCRAVGVRLVVGLRQHVDQVEIVAFDGVDEMPRPIAVGRPVGRTWTRRTPDP